MGQVLPVNSTRVGDHFKKVYKSAWVLCVFTALRPPVSSAETTTDGTLQLKPTDPVRTSPIEPSDKERARGALQSSIPSCGEFLFIERSQVEKHPSFWCKGQSDCVSRPFLEIPDGGAFTRSDFKLSDGTPIALRSRKALEAVGQSAIQKVDGHIRWLESKRAQLAHCPKTLTLDSPPSSRPSETENRCRDVIRSLLTGQSQTPSSNSLLSSDDLKRHRFLVSFLSQGNPTRSGAGLILPKSYKGLTIEEILEQKREFDRLKDAVPAAASTSSQFAPSTRNVRFIRRTGDGTAVLPRELETGSGVDNRALASSKTVKWLERYIADHLGDPGVANAYATELENRSRELEALHAKNPLMTQLSHPNPSASELREAIEQYTARVLKPARVEYSVALKKASRPSRGSTEGKANSIPDSLLKFTEHDVFLEQYIQAAPPADKASLCQVLTAMSKERSDRDSSRSLATLSAMGAVLLASPILGAPVVIGGLAASGIALTVKEGQQAESTVRDAEAGATSIEKGTSAQRVLEFGPVMIALDMMGTGTAVKAAAIGTATAGAMALKRVSFGAIARAPEGSELKVAADEVRRAVDQIATNKEVRSSRSQRALEQARSHAQKSLEKAIQLLESRLIPTDAIPQYQSTLEKFAEQGHLGTETQPNLILATSLREEVASQALDPQAQQKTLETVGRVMSSVPPQMTGDPVRDNAARAMLPRMVATLSRMGHQINEEAIRDLMLSNEMTTEAWIGLKLLYEKLSTIARQANESTQNVFRRAWAQAGGDAKKADRVYPCAMPIRTVSLNDRLQPSNSRSTQLVCSLAASSVQ